MNKGLALVAACAVCFVSQARTVALWPLEKTTDGKFDGRCVIDPANDLGAVNNEQVAGTLGWNLPPNPDKAFHAYEPLNSGAVRENPQLRTTSKSTGFLYNGNVGKYLQRTCDFTIEGYIKLLEIPQRDKWACILGGFADQVGDAHRWTLSFRRRASENYACTWIVWANMDVDTVFRAYASEEESYGLTNKWMHIALTHSAIKDNNDVWTFYIDGVKQGEVNAYGNTPKPAASKQFDLGARRTDNNMLAAEYDYWRVSDEVLTPDKFLCAGESGATVEPSHTVAYWPLEVSPSGNIDGRDAVGDAPLSGGFHPTVARYNTMSMSEDCAFPGNPPNATAALSTGNAGCFQGCQTGGCLVQNDVGAFLNLSESFTVEGWFAPRLIERTPKGDGQAPVAYLFGTRPDYEKGWILQYRAKGMNNFLFDLYCIDQSGNLKDNIKLSGDYNVGDWYETWHHLALVYDKTGGDAGFGRWSLYIDGQLVGWTDNTRAVKPITDGRPFILGGRAEVAAQSFQGKVDCVRVSQAALQPGQFLCAKEGAAAASNVLAYWPLNVERGAYPDLRDVSGNGRHFANRDSFYNVQLAKGDAATPGPVIRNPDRSPNFRGDPRSANGSVRFRNPDTDPDYHRSYLATGGKTAMNAVKGGKDFTFECYYMRKKSSKNVSGDQEVLFATADNSAVSIRFFRKSTGLYIWENRNGNIADTLIPGTSNNDLKFDTWYHVALVHEIATVDGTRKTVWRIYVDGDLKGTASANYNNNGDSNYSILIGGRYFSDRNSVIGNLSSVRLSDCALAPADFLCAKPSQPIVDEQPTTVSYWPIDNVAPGLANVVNAGCAFVASGSAQGQDAKVARLIPNRRSMPEVTGAGRANHGSYALGGGSLTAPNVGFACSLGRPFTVEGWVKWIPAADTGDEDLVCAGETDSGVGVRLYFDKSGATPQLAVRARDAWPSTPMVSGTFGADLSPYLGVWTHLAVVYDPLDGLGTWRLYVNGKPTGSPVVNFWRPTAQLYFRSGDFRLREGSVDMWRIASGALKPEEFLYADPQGWYLILQ